MRISLVLVLISVFATSKCDEPAQRTDETLYSEATFKELVADQKHFIMFYAPWCGHCQRLKPVWENLAEEINGNSEIDISIAKVDCTVETKLCSDEGVMGYPTLKLFHPSRDSLRYKGGRDFESLKSFVIAAVNPLPDPNQFSIPNDGLHELTEDNFENHVSTGHHFIKFFAPWCGHCKRLEPAWAQLAKAHTPSEENKGDVKVGRVDCTVQKSVCSKHEVRGYPTLLWFNNGQVVKKYQSGRDIDSFERFITEMTTGEAPPPPVEDKAPPKPAPPKPVPVFQEEPKEQEPTTPVLVLTGKDFDFNIALDVTFVMFYAPWCGYCKRLAPTWEDLAVSDFSEVESPVKIAKIDCTEYNHICQAFEVGGYPTLILFKDGDKVAKYKGNRSMDDLKSFIIKNSKEVAQEAKDEL
uniref:thioredoxin domain-containing protein 5 n=1 Tax=Ciona intestinalis TaxID=7719 RepID=UPI000052194F|nr:thioredoxin domain-containing protein 5 [Ciona intestinalis]|eukprot:XP_002131987.1 thioredoxin domain-containing protein 5 [Ciona intestinalis]